MKGNIDDGFRFGAWQAFPTRNLLLGPPGEVHIEPKVMQVLKHLASHPGQVVDRDTLLDGIWEGRAFSDEPLSRCIFELRQALGDSSKDPKYIETIPKSGYRLICTVESLADATDDASNDFGEQSVVHNWGILTGRRRIALPAFLGLILIAAVFVAYRSIFPGQTESPQLAVEGTTQSDPPVYSIAVLPFINRSPDPAQEYFSDGISEDLLNLLAQAPELRVISRSSAFSFKGQEIGIPAVAKQLNVAHVVEGSVRKVGNRVRITAQLIDARSDSHVWSESYDRELDDIFAVQNEIAIAISDALKVRLALGKGEAEQATGIRATNPDAYDVYLMALDVRRPGGYLATQEAVRLLEHSLRLDSNFAPAHAELARAILSLREGFGFDGTLSREEVLRRAIPHLDRAAELEPNLAAVHEVRAWIAFEMNDRESAIKHAQKALTVNPSSINAMTSLAIAFQDLSRYEEMLEIDDQILATDPLSILGRSNHILGLCEMGRIDEAREMAHQLLADNLWSGYRRLGYIALFYEGKVAEAVSWLLKAHAEEPENTNSNRLLVDALITLGEYEEARRISDRFTAVVDVAEGRFDAAIRSTQTKMQLDLQDQTDILAAADTLYKAGRIDEALPLYERLRELGPEGYPVAMNWEATMQLAVTRRRAGDESGARAAAQILMKDVTAYRQAIGESLDVYKADAMLAAFDNDHDGVIAALRAAMELGLRNPQVFADAIFEDLRADERFVSLQQELDELLAEEHYKYLQLVCFNNPVSDDWRPMPETCEGVIEQPML